MRLPVDPIFPIKHVYVHEWRFDESKSLEEIAKRIKKHHYFVMPRKNILVITTPVKPTVIIVLIQRSIEGGELILINMDKYYSRIKVLQGIWIFQNKSGIKVIDFKYL